MPGIALGILNLGRGELHLVQPEARVTLRMPYRKTGRPPFSGEV